MKSKPANFSHYVSDDARVHKYNLIRAAFNRVGTEVDIWAIDSREKSLAVTKLEEAWLWATRSIAIHNDDKE